MRGDNGRKPFVWHTVDLRSELPEGWTDEIAAAAARHAQRHDLVPVSVTSREDLTVAAVPVLTVDGTPIARELPWLHELYESRVRELAEWIFREPVLVACDARHAINLNVQRGTTMRYEAHVDSNPVGALLYSTTHPPGAGGELVVSNRGDVSGIDEIEADCSRIHPVSGHLVLFDARRHSHYVAPLRDPSGERIVVAMNLYTASAPESERPADLSTHLFGTQQHEEQQPA